MANILDLTPFLILKVSSLVAARRALDLELISREGFFEFYEGYLEDERRKAPRQPGRGDFYKTQGLRVGRAFGTAVARAVGEGKLLFSEAYHLTGLYGATFERYTKSLLPGGVR